MSFLYLLSLGVCPTYELWLEKKQEQGQPTVSPCDPLPLLEIYGAGGSQGDGSPPATKSHLEISDIDILYMSSIAAAKRRRAGGDPTPPPIPQQTQSQSQQMEAPKLTIQQAFGIIDSRLSALEKATKPDTTNSTANLEYMEEMDAKFLMLAEEITAMKDIVLKLQAFTMEVNQKMSEKLGLTTSMVDTPNITISTSIAEELGDSA